MGKIEAKEVWSVSHGVVDAPNGDNRRLRISRCLRGWKGHTRTDS